MASLDEAGTDLTICTAFPPAQRRCLRTMSAIERILGEFKRHTKTQGAFATLEAMMIVLWGAKLIKALGVNRRTRLVPTLRTDETTRPCRRLLLLLVAGAVGAGACRATHDRGRAMLGMERPIEIDTMPIIAERDTATHCSRCRIQVDSIGALGSAEDSVFPKEWATLVEAANQRFEVAPVSSPNQVGEFSWNGRFVRLLGHSGDGPGELRQVLGLGGGGDSSLLVYTPGRFVRLPLSLGRASSFIATRALVPRWIIAMPGDGILVNDVYGNLRSFVYFGAGVGNAKGFGDSIPPYTTAVRGRSQLRKARLIAPAGAGTFWAVSEYFEPTLELWDTGGALRRRYRLPEPWFQPYDDGAFAEFLRKGIPGMRPLSHNSGAWRDREGRLWTITEVPDSRWHAIMLDESQMLGERAEDRIPAPWAYDRTSLVDAIVAVYEVSDSGVFRLTSARFDTPFSGFVSDSVLYRHVSKDKNFSQFVLYRFRLAFQP